MNVHFLSPEEYLQSIGERGLVGLRNNRFLAACRRAVEAHLREGTLFEGVDQRRVEHIYAALYLKRFKQVPVGNNGCFCGN